ncbi:MAG: acyl-CoA dehydrogenase family protein, partial [Actinobacteria bacterium]
MARRLRVLSRRADLRRHERDPTQHRRRARAGSAAIMRFQPTADQQLFARTVRELLEKECPPEAARAGFSAERWAKLREMGVIDMLASGMTEIDLVPILEEAGRAALPEPLIEAALIAGGALDGVVTAAVGSRFVAHADVA